VEELPGEFDSLKGDYLDADNDEDMAEDDGE
jgi:hypothetical protein